MGQTIVTATGSEALPLAPAQLFRVTPGPRRARLMERLDGAVRGALRGAGVPDAGALADVTRVWPAVVGDAIARASWPQRISRDGTLLVAAASSTWAFELGLLADQILAKLAAEIGSGSADRDSLRARARSPRHPRRSPRRRPLEPPEIDDETRLLAEELTSGMSDAELRETIARAAAASLARAASSRHF